MTAESHFLAYLLLCSDQDGEPSVESVSAPNGRFGRPHGMVWRLYVHNYSGEMLASKRAERHWGLRLRVAIPTAVPRSHARVCASCPQWNEE